MFKLNYRNFMFDINKTKNFLIYLFTVSFLLIFSVLLYITKPPEIIIKSNHNESDMVIGSIDWQDSTFDDYERRARIYLDRFPESPITAEMLKLAAWNAYDSTGVLVPVELALAQAQLESSMGTKGRSPKNNPYNIGEYDDRTVIWFDNTFDGIQAYYYLMARTYLNHKPIHILLKSFTNMNGHRYASNPDYEVMLKILISQIEQYTENVILENMENEITELKIEYIET